MSFGFSLSDFYLAIRLAGKVRKQYIQAPKEFHDISDDVRNFTNVLEGIQNHYQKFEPGPGEKETIDEITKSCNALLQDLQKTLDKYTELERPKDGGGRTFHKRVWKRIKWDPGDIRDLRARISTQMDMLKAVEGSLNRSVLLDTKSGVDHLREVHDTQKLQEQRQAIKIWLSAIGHGAHQNSSIKLRQPGTGNWLLDTEEFRTWLKTDKQTLFCPGIPGAGKTVLTAVVVDHLTTLSHEDPTVGIAYIYCNFKRKEEQTIEDLLGSLLSQLVGRHGHVPKDVQALYDMHREKRTRPSRDELSTTLQLVVTTYSRVFLIIDALDELQIHDCDRRKFLSELFKIQAKQGANIFATSRLIPEIIEEFKGSVELEIRARSEDVNMYVAGHMERLPKCVQRNQRLQEDIKAGISEAVDGMFLLAHIYLRSLEDEYTAKNVRDKLNGFKKQIQESGEDNKNIAALNHAYGDIMERIQGQKGKLKSLANRVLSWVTCATRPLSVFELQEALAVEVGDRMIDEDNKPDIQDMISVCLGLVTVDEGSQVIQLAHYTTQEYLEQTRGDWFPDADSEITAICATYLTFDVFGNGACETFGEFDQRLESHRLYGYASRNWNDHARKAPFCEEIIGFLKCQAKAEASNQVLRYDESPIPSYLRCYGNQITRDQGTTGLHLAAYVGAEDLVKELIKANMEIDATGSQNQTPLSYAAQKGHDTTVKLLLDSGKADINSESIKGRTPLSYAAGNGHYATVKLLLDSGKADINPESKKGRRPLSYAAEGGHMRIVKLLLGNGAKLEPSDIGRWGVRLGARPQGRTDGVRLFLENVANLAPETLFDLLTLTGFWIDEDTIWLLLNKTTNIEPKTWSVFVLESADSGFKDLVQFLVAPNQVEVSRAAVSTHKAAVEQLLATGKVDLDCRDGHGSTPLSRAAESGHKAIVELLITTGKVDLDCRDDYGQTPLSRAAEYGNKEVVELLITTGQVELDSRDASGRAPLSWAAFGGHKAMVELLITTGKVELDSRDDEGRTPLSHAARRGYKEIVELLITTGKVDLDSRDDEERTPLSHAAEHGNKEIVELLCKEGAFCDSRDSYGRTPLQWAARHGRAAVAKVLVDGGTNFHPETQYEEMLLLYAAEKGRKEDVKLIIDEGVSLVARDEDGQTSLSLAASRGCSAVVELLLNRPDRSRYLESKDLNGRTALHHVIDRRGFDTDHATVMYMLLNSGIDVEAKDDDGLTALHLAIQRGNMAVAKLLVSKRVGLDSQDNKGRTPLSYAVQGRDTYLSLVKLLLENGTQPDSKDHCGRTVLSYAADSTNTTIVKVLLERGADPSLKDDNGRSPLSYAAASRHGASSVFKFLLEHGGDPNEEDYDRRPLLSYAAENGLDGMAATELLLERNAKANSKDRRGRTPLSYAAQSGAKAIVKLLLEQNGDPNEQDHNGRSLLSYAASSWDSATAKLLLERNAEPNSKDRRGRTPLSYAAESGIQSIVKLLLERNAEPNSKDRRGRTPLSYAAQNENEKEAMVELLLEQNSDVNQEDYTGRSPLSHAAQCETWRVTEVLVKQGADLESKDTRQGWTPLMWAATSGSNNVVRFLLQEGAAVNPEDNHGRTAVSLAARYGRKATARLLWRKGAKPEPESLSCTFAPLNRQNRICGICRLYIPDQDVYYRCHKCRRYLKFYVCSICYDEDPHCLNDSHQLDKIN